MTRSIHKHGIKTEKVNIYKIPNELKILIVNVN